MPIYEFSCRECGTRFEELADVGTASVLCRACGSEATARVYSAQGPSPKLVKTAAQNRRRERSNAQLRESTRRRLSEARRRAGKGGGGA